jgi:hypothetical protein
MTYLAFVLDAASRAKLLNEVPAMFERVIAHHVTLIFPKTEEEKAEMRRVYLSLTSISGTKPTVKVINHYVGEHIHAVGVKVNGGTARNNGGFYHVTVSLESPAKPVDSNKLVSPTALEPFELTGTVQLVD